MENNPAIALPPELHRQIGNLSSFEGRSAAEVLRRHIDQMRGFTPDYVLVVLERESLKFIELLGQWSSRAAFFPSLRLVGGSSLFRFETTHRGEAFAAGAALWLWRGIWMSVAQLNQQQHNNRAAPERLIWSVEL